MANAQPNAPMSHNELIALLPWYVNKSLKGQELLELEKHLSTCLVCKHEFNELRKLAQVVALDNSFDSAEKASFSRLKHRLHAAQPVLIEQNSANQRSIFGPVNQVVQFNAKSKGNKARTYFNSSIWAVAATILIALLIPFSISNNNSTSINSFRTLSDGQSEKLNKNEVRVVFADKVDDHAINSILERIHGQIVAKPSEQGVYTIKLEKDIAAKQLLNVVELLRKDDSVIFAEPAYAFLSSLNKESN